MRLRARHVPQRPRQEKGRSHGRLLEMRPDRGAPEPLHKYMLRWHGCKLKAEGFIHAFLHFLVGPRNIADLLQLSLMV